MAPAHLQKHEHREPPYFPASFSSRRHCELRSLSQFIQLIAFRSFNSLSANHPLQCIQDQESEPIVESEETVREMEPMAPVQQTSQQTSPSAVIRTPESLRQRQRDRLSPRGRFGKSDPISTSIREVEGVPRNAVTLAPAPRPSRCPDQVKKQQDQEGLRKQNSVHRRAKREAEDVKYDIAPDGGSAGREGRQFTVANVGNNGRIYLR